MRRHDYTIVEASNTHDLIDRVRAHLKDGWKAQGGITMAYGTYMRFFQAMTKTNEPPIDLGAPEYDP